MNDPMITRTATYCINALRRSGYSDHQILMAYAVPHAAADSRYEMRQVAARGFIEAPADAVTTEMRRLLLVEATV